MQIRNGVLLLFMAMLLIGCTARRPLMLTPNLYAAGQHELFINLAPELKTNRVDLFCVTDAVSPPLPRPISRSSRS